MFKLPRILQRRAPHRPEGAEGLRSLFVKFRRILDMNTRVLERMAVMEQALGGDSIFDQAFLDSSVREITSHVHQVVYSLNALCDERYVDLYDRYVEIKNILGDILAGGHGPWPRPRPCPPRPFAGTWSPWWARAPRGCANCAIAWSCPRPTASP